MHAATITDAGAPPIYREIPDPHAGPGQRLIHVSAAALSHVTRSRAAGKHYSAGGAAGTPGITPGIDGCGRLEDGRRVYFLLPRLPLGSMAELCVIDEAQLIPLPDGLGDAEAAALAIPAMSSWAALNERAAFKPGETVCINGATGISGGLAVQIAKRLGAKKVIATGRNPAALARLAQLGADLTISLQQPPDALAQALQSAFSEGVDVVLDYLWGASAEAMLVAATRAAPEGHALRFVQIGSMAGADITLPSAVLRSSAITLMGSGINSVPLERLKEAVRAVFESAAGKPFELPIETAPLSRITELWSRHEATPRLVFLP